MKTLISRLCFVGALTLGVIVVWTIMTPQKLQADQGDLLTGGVCREAVMYECPDYCNYAEYGECEITERKICCRILVGSGFGCGGGGDGCVEQDAEEYTCGSCP